MPSRYQLLTYQLPVGSSMPGRTNSGHQYTAHASSSCPLPEHTVPCGQPKACPQRGFTHHRLFLLVQPLSSVQQIIKNSLWGTEAAPWLPHLAQKCYDSWLGGCYHCISHTLGLVRRKKLRLAAHLLPALIDILLIAPSHTGKALCTTLGQLLQCQEFLAGRPALMVLPGKLQFQQRIWWLSGKCINHKSSFVLQHFKPFRLSHMAAVCWHLLFDLYKLSCANSYLTSL